MPFRDAYKISGQIVAHCIQSREVLETLPLATYRTYFPKQTDCLNEVNAMTANFAVLDENLMMLPVPIEVTKNFCGDGEANIYNQLDTGYGEAILPIPVNMGEKISFPCLMRMRFHLR